jgi:hypothetical protein
VLGVRAGGAPATVQPFATGAVRAGRLITLLAALGSAVTLAYLGLAQRGRRRRRPQRSSQAL